MALVMLPCDLPWWSNVYKRLTLLQETDDTNMILELMQKLHDLCNVSLDPEEDKCDATLFDGLRDFLQNDMDLNEREHFKTVTLRNLAKRAQSLKSLRPPRGLSFSLQQQPDKLKINYTLVAALLANAFFSTFPKRTEKTHPTLQDFNFTHFFKNLHNNSQKTKFRCFLKYFDWLETAEAKKERSTATTTSTADGAVKTNVTGTPAEGAGNLTADNINDQLEAHTTIKISRKVMSAKQWLTIEDWLECGLPLCPLEIKHEGRIERAQENVVQTIFASARLGGSVLSGGNSQECMSFCTFPEMLAILLYVEALEDNEALFVEDARQLCRAMGGDGTRKSYLETLETPRTVSLCLIDAENYSDYPVNQFEEDNVLRELNKCLLAFRQNTTCSALKGGTAPRLERRSSSSTSSLCSRDNNKDSKEQRNNSVQRRLSPIGESGSNSPKDVMQIIVKQASTSTKRSSYDSGAIENDIDRRRSWLAVSRRGDSNSSRGDAASKSNSVVTGPTAANRRGRFIVLGSSGECLPVNRKSQVINAESTVATTLQRCDSNSIYSSCDSGNSEDEEYHSARTSFEDCIEDDLEMVKKYCNELDTPEKRHTFAEKLREALRQSSNYTESTDDSYAVDISISGSKTDPDEGIRIRRGGSRGFALKEDSFCEDLYVENLEQEQTWLEKFRSKYPNNGNILMNLKKDTNANMSSDQKSKYSMAESSDFSSELEEIYEQFSKWLDDPILKDNVKNLDARDETVLKFASSLLKRTLSESYVGIPLTDGCIESTCIPAEQNCIQTYQKKKNREMLNPRSLSLELAKHNHRLASQLNNECGTDNENSPSKSLMNKLTSLNQRTNKPPMNWKITRMHSQQTINCDDITMKISQIGKNRTGKDGIRAVATGNWGCGSACSGDVQLKLVIQWMAASVAGLPALIYYTAGHEKLTKSDTLCRVLRDRKWTVGELASITLLYAQEILDDPKNNEQSCLFESLIGI